MMKLTNAPKRKAATKANLNRQFLIAESVSRSSRVGK
jgi:hypothetical protein